MPSATRLSLTGYIWTRVGGGGKGWGKVAAEGNNVASEPESLSEAAHCCLPPPSLWAMSQQGLGQWSWKMSRGKLLKGPCSLVLRLSCVRRAVWIVKAEAGGLQLWEKGGRGKNEGTPQGTPRWLVVWNSEASASTGDFSIGKTKQQQQPQQQDRNRLESCMRRKGEKLQWGRIMEIGVWWGGCNFSACKKETQYTSLRGESLPYHSSKLGVVPKVHYREQE